MSETERLAEAAALLMERKKKMDEVNAIERKLEAVLGVSAPEKRKKPVYRGQEWEKILRAGV